MRGYRENKSCSCCARNVSLAQTKQRRYFGHVAEKSHTASCWFESETQPPWQQAGLAAATPDAWALWSALPSCAQAANTCRAKGKRLLFPSSMWPEQACAAQPLGLPDPPPCPWDGLHSPLCPERKAGRGPSSWHHLCLHCSPQARRAAEGMGEPLPPTRLLQGSTWPSSALKMKQQVLVAHSAAGHAGRCMFIKNQCSNQVSGEQTKPANLHLY